MDNNPIVQVQQGKLCGIRETNVVGNNPFYAFRGIPYAKSPVGDLRFKDPEPVEPWSGVKDAKEYGGICAQYDWRTKQIVGSDDCLYLNVFTRELNPAIPRAVMVWIHGGGFVGGSGNDDVYGPDYLVEKDIVLVTINYRLGILGFLNLEDESAPGNQGLKDQVMALKWVQQNISKFGGDQNNATIFGESAGGAAVHYLTLSPLTQGLFHKAILQSGVATNPWASSSHSMKEEAEKIADKLGNKVTDTKRLIEYLQTIDAISLVKTLHSLQTWKHRLLISNPFLPSVDSKSKNPFLNVPLNEAVKSGIKVPTIIGYTSHEGIILLAELKDDHYAQIEANADALLLHPNAKKFLNERNVSVGDIKNFFMGNKKISSENVKEYVDLLSAAQFLINIHHILEIQPSIPGIPTYVYKFDYYSKETSIMQKVFGVDCEGTSHGEELFYFFYPKMFKVLGMEPLTPGSTEYSIQQRFLHLWTTFAKTGNPNSKSEQIPIEWRPIDNSTEYTCLKISKDLSLIKESSILHQIYKLVKNKL